MKKIVKYLLFIIIAINLLILISGKSWIYKAISITYLKGHTSSYIHDFVHFPANTIEAGTYEEWLIAKDYNKVNLPEFIKPTNKELETVAFLVIINDSITYEEYWHGYSEDSASNSFSMSKSYISTLVGVAIKDNIINIDQKVCDFLPEYCGEKEKLLTIKNLLTMSSGLNWNESYYNPLGKIAEAYYGNNLKKLVMNLKVIEPPGKVFKYYSCNTQLLAFILENTTGKSINEYASEKLWIPMGAKHPALWNTDTKGGDEKAFCCINSNARDFARIGKLYMNNGNWNGTQIIDSTYVSQATTSAADLLDKDGNKNLNYGYQFWITNYKDLDIYYARGLWGQYVICIPDKDMIIVRLGRKYGKSLEDGHHEDFYQFIDAALEMYD
ncbi:MAG: serine hydrolase [Flavobacteriales bacterium]|nr:serine hydrolase [Flavobacteriales bacterium]